MEDIAKNEIINAITKLINEKFDNMEVTVRQMQEDIKQMQEDIGILKEQVAVIPKMQEDIKQIQVKVIPKMQNDIEELKEYTRNISRSVAVIEQEHGEKIQILLDLVTGHTEKFEEQNKKINKCEKKIEKHDSELYYLNEKIQGI